MRVASGLFPHFELIDEYEAPLEELQFDDFKAVLSQKIKPQAHPSSPKYPRKHLKIVYELNRNREDF
jgi:alanine racemase